MRWEKFAGIIPPLVTPLDEQQQIDREGLTRLLDHVVSGGVHGVFILGTTGEGPHIGYASRLELIDLVCQSVDNLPVLVNVSDNALDDAVSMADFAADHGASAVVATPPSYLPADADDMTRFFCGLADRSPLPVLLYNIPFCTHRHISLTTVQQCIQHPNITGIKDSGGDFAFFQQILNQAEARADWSVLIGPEEMLVEALRMGACGAVCGGANLVPKLFLQLANAVVRGDEEMIVELQRRQLAVARIYEYAGGVERAGFIRGMKLALSQLGICRNIVSEPFQAIGDDEDVVRRSLEQLAADMPVPTAAPR